MAGAVKSEPPIKIDSIDIKPLTVKLNTNIPGNKSIDLQTLGFPIIISPIKGDLPYYTDKYELVLEKLSSFKLEEIYEFFFSKSVFQKRISEVSIFNSIKTKEEIASDNIRIMLSLLFYTSPVSRNINDSYSILGGSHSTMNISNSFKFLSGAIKDIFKSESANQYIVNGKKYTLTRVVWLNDFVNNPTTKRLYYEFRKFRRWAVKTGSEEDWKTPFVNKRIWDNLDSKDTDESNPIVIQKREVKKFFAKYPPFEDFFYKILKTNLPFITNDAIKTILSSKNTTHIIEFFVAIHQFVEDGNIDKVNSELDRIYSLLQTNGKNVNKTIETTVVLVDGKQTIFILADFIEGTTEDKDNKLAINDAKCSQKRARLLKGIGNLSSDKPKNNTEITNEEGIFSLDEKRVIKPEEETPLDDEVGDYEVKIVKEVKPKDVQEAEKFDIIINNSLELKQKNYSQTDFYNKLKEGIETSRGYGKSGYDGVFDLVENWKYYEDNESDIVEMLENLYKVRGKYSKKIEEQRDLIEKNTSEKAKQTGISRGQRKEYIKDIDDRIKRSEKKIEYYDFIVIVLNSMIKYENDTLDQPISVPSSATPVASVPVLPSSGGSKTIKKRRNKRKIKKTRRFYK